MNLYVGPSCGAREGFFFFPCKGVFRKCLRCRLSILRMGSGRFRGGEIDVYKRQKHPTLRGRALLLPLPAVILMLLVMVPYLLA